MNYLKILGLAAIAAVALSGFAASPASATTLEHDGITENDWFILAASLEIGESSKLKFTNTTLANTCAASNFSGKTSTFTGTKVSGAFTAMSFSSCTTEKVVVDKAGNFSISWISGTTNGTLTSSGTEVTVPSPIGTLNCKTLEGIDIGTITGVASGTATIDINAVLNCGFLAPSATWTASYYVTEPSALGVSS